MKKLLRYWQTIRYSLWFIPTVIVGFALLLAIAAIDLDSNISADILARWPHVFGASADGARGMLQAIASAMITVGALTFSITVLVLSLGASQYTPRIIRTFMGNRPTQAVLGVFIGIFAYCLVVLRSIRGGNNEFIPSVAVTLAIVLALVGVGFLVYFIHHIASSIQASAIASSVSADTMRVIDRLYPDKLVDHPEHDRSPAETAHAGREWHPVPAYRTGYLQTVDLDALVALAEKRQLVVRMEKSVGSFISEGLALAYVTAPADAALVREFNHAYAISHYRTVEQDAGVGIRQLVDIALKAMSPAMNDTTTAIMCIDYLSAIAVRLAPRCIVPDLCYCNGALRVITRGASFEDLLRLAFEQIRENAQATTAIYVRLLEALATLAGATDDVGRRRQIAAHMQYVVDYARKQSLMPDQLSRIERHQVQAMEIVRR